MASTRINASCGVFCSFAVATQNLATPELAAKAAVSKGPAWTPPDSADRASSATLRHRAPRALLGGAETTPLPLVPCVVVDEEPEPSVAALSQPARTPANNRTAPHRRVRSFPGNTEPALITAPFVSYHGLCSVLRLHPCPGSCHGARARVFSQALGLLRTQAGQLLQPVLPTVNDPPCAAAHQPRQYRTEPEPPAADGRSLALTSRLHEAGCPTGGQFSRECP